MIWHILSFRLIRFDKLIIESVMYFTSYFIDTANHVLVTMNPFTIEKVLPLFECTLVPMTEKVVTGFSEVVIDDH